MPQKRFRDVLENFEKLKYIYEYGFAWDEKMAKFVLGIGAQNARALENVIGSSLYETSVAVPRHEYSDIQKSSTYRKLIKANHYRLQQNRWEEALFGGYAFDPRSKEKIEECKKKNVNYQSCTNNGIAMNCSYRDECETQYKIELCRKDYCDYQTCRDAGTLSGCKYRNECKIQKELDFFKTLAKEDFVICKPDPIEEEIKKNYSDVLLINRHCVSGLKENEWIYKEGGIFKDRKEYKSFLSMLRFFADFSPLSIVGANFWKRLRMGKEGYEEQEDCILVRNLPFLHGLEQEYIYRCLYAIVHKRLLRYKTNEQNFYTDYVPLQIYYKSKNSTGLKDVLCLKARRVSGRSMSNKMEYLSLSDGCQIYIGNKIPDIELSQMLEYEQKKGQLEYKVLFYYNNNTEYLLRRRREGWNIHEERYWGTVEMDSPYYPKQKEWYCDEVVYLIDEEDRDGFEQFIDSFGDFSKKIGYSEIKPIFNKWLSRIEEKNIQEEDGKNKQKALKEYHSLLSIYNSSILLEDKEIECLPPRQVELEWLKFVFCEYPNLIQIFLSRDTVEKIEENLEEISCEGWFSIDNFQYETRVHDLPNSVINKYRQIYAVVKQKQVLTYAHNGQEEFQIFPYMLEYDVCSHLVGDIGTSRTPISVMCYNISQKRNINIHIKDIHLSPSMTTIQEQKEIQFSKVDKLYHIAAYAVRSAVEGKVNIENCFENVLDCVWEYNSRGNRNYERIVKKYWETDVAGKKEKFEEAYKNYVAFSKEIEDVEIEHYRNQVFAYYFAPEQATERFVSGKEREFIDRYYQLLLYIFLNGCMTLKNIKEKESRETYEKLRVRSDNLFKALNKISNEQIWNLIAGEEQNCEEHGNDVANEIAFFNENLNKATITFRLKREHKTKENVDLVFKLFRNFVCVGDMDKDENIYFTVTYETFYYRKIHMNLMTIVDKIEDIQPEKTADVIKKRVENMQKNK